MDWIVSRCQSQAQYLETQWTRYAPILYILIGTFLISINSLISKLLPQMNANQLVYGRGITMIIIGFSVSKSCNVGLYCFNNTTQNKILMRSVIGCFATLLFYTGLKYVNIAEAQVLLQTSPFWTTIISIYLLKTESLSCNLVLNLFMCFIGISMITQPPSLMNIFGLSQTNIQSEYHLYGCLLLLTSALLFSLVQILINNLAGEVHQLVIPQYFGLISMIISTLTCIIDPSFIWKIPNFVEWQSLLSIGTVAYLQQIFLNRAYMKGNLTEMSMLGQTQVLYGYIFDLLRGAHISLLSCCGTGLIIFALFRIIIAKNKKKQITGEQKN